MGQGPGGCPSTKLFSCERSLSAGSCGQGQVALDQIQGRQVFFISTRLVRKAEGLLWCPWCRGSAVLCIGVFVRAPCLRDLSAPVPSWVRDPEGRRGRGWVCTHSLASPWTQPRPVGRRIPCREITVLSGCLSLVTWGPEETQHLPPAASMPQPSHCPCLAQKP